MEKKEIKKTVIVATKEEKQALEKTKRFFQDLDDLTTNCEESCSICPLKSYCDRSVYVGCQINKIVEMLDETIKNIE
jgi:hypothetical protein